MRQKNKFTALVALAQTVSRRSIKESAINAWKVLLMQVIYCCVSTTCQG